MDECLLYDHVKCHRICELIVTIIVIIIITPHVLLEELFLQER